MNDVLFTLWRAKNYVRSVVPYVKRKKFDRVVREYRELLQVIAATPRASNARIRTLKAPSQPVHGDVCLFVTHADRPELKRYVVDYIVQLLDAGIEVVLIANTDIHIDTLHIDPTLMPRLLAAYARENIGFDFAAWSHGLRLSAPDRTFERLYLINDSMAGPLDNRAFLAMIQRVRGSPADVIGLTDNALPRPHLQSYFLVFSRRAQQSDAWKAVFRDALAFTSKEHVIVVYETQVTAILQAAGLSTQCLFPQIESSRDFTSYVHFRWQELVERGMPFVKASIVRERLDDPEMIALVPEPYRRELSPPRQVGK